MLMQLKIVPLVIFLLFTSSYPQKIQSINVLGNKVFSEKEIINWSGLIPQTELKQNFLDSALAKISYKLSSNGYFHSNFDGCSVDYNQDSSLAYLKLFVDEGEPTYIKSINIISDSTHEIISDFDYLEGRIFNKAEIEEIIEQLLRKYENTGYPFAKVKLTSANFFEDSLNSDYQVNLSIKIEKGVKGTIDKIEIIGNDKTNADVIIRELRIKLGGEYSQRAIEELPSKLNRLRFFEPVSMPQFYIDSDNKGTLLIEVKEKQTNNFDGIIGYLPANRADESGYVTGLINVSLRNIFGTGRSTLIRWQKLDRNSQELELKYLEPWFFNFPFNIIVGFNQRKQDTIYVQRKFEASVEYLATETISASLSLSTEAIIPTESTGNIFKVFNSNSLTTGVALKIDSRDDPYAPTEGIMFNNSYSYSRKRIYGPQQFILPDAKTKINLQRISVEFGFFYSFFTRQVAALKVNWRELQGSFFEISDLFRLGGTNSLRGYREDQFLGSRIFWSNLEYRLLLAKRSYVFLFFDTGYYLVNEDPSAKLARQEAFNIGYGLGLNVETALGVIGVSFALAKGDSFSDGKIHFGLVSEF